MTKQYTIAKLSVGGIKCDTDGCGWNDMSILVKDYRDWLNKPCPDCGGNLLTQEDYNMTLKQIYATLKINQLANTWLPKFVLRWLDINRPGAEVEVREFDRSGKLKIKLEDKDDG